MQVKGYVLADNAAMAAEALNNSALFDEAVKTAVLKPQAVRAIYAAEEKRWSVNDFVPSIPSAWIRGVLGGVLGGVGGTITGALFLGIFGAVVLIPVALAIGVGAITGIALGNPNETVGRGQMKQDTFKDVETRLRVPLEEYLKLLVDRGYIKTQYKREDITDVNLFNAWVQFFAQETRAKFPEDFFVLGALALKVQQAWTRGQALNAKISDPAKQRTIADAVQFGIAEYHGMRPALVAAQTSAGVIVNDDEVTDARYAPLVPHLKADDAAYVAEVYSAVQ